MREKTIAMAAVVACTAAHANKYGIDEATRESDGSLSDMVWGGLILWVAYLAWKKFFG